MSVSLDYENGVLVYRSPYDAALVAALKGTVPASDRRWDPSRRCWLVAALHADALVQLTEQHLGKQIAAPRVPQQAATIETRILDCRYIGATKERGDGNPTAFAWIGGEWAAIFPEKALREWFNADMRPDESPTLYAALGLPVTADDLALRAAYRRLARTWHPDVCHDADAAQQFLRIQHAYEVLREPRLRARYDAGLALGATVTARRDLDEKMLQGMAMGYRAPLRCGLIMAEGHEVLGRFAVSRILEWADIHDAAGRVLVASWPAGAQAPEESWT